MLVRGNVKSSKIPITLKHALHQLTVTTRPVSVSCGQEVGPSGGGGGWRGEGGAGVGEGVPW